MFNKIDLNKHGESLLLIFLGIGFFIWTRGFVEKYSPANTNYIKGVLSEAPRVGSQGGDYDYIALKLKGFKDSYRFSKCSLNEMIQTTVCKMLPGDSIYFYAMKKWSTKSITFKNNTAKTYRICEAKSPKYGYFINFSGFNNCTNWEKYTFYPILSSFIVLLGLWGLRKKQS